MIRGGEQAAAGAESLRLAKLEVFVLRAPVEVPVRTSFGTMLDRPALLLRVEDDAGAAGWGEVWCNFPAVGAEHRARLVQSLLAPILIGTPFHRPEEIFELLTRQLHILVLQSGEPGPIAQIIAALDVALWDLVARRAGQPLWRMLGGSDTVKVYASGLNPDHPETLAAAKYREGYRAFKLKVGFGRDTDLDNLGRLRETLGHDARIMLDANQAWQPAEAAAMSKAFASFSPFWLEEPIASDCTIETWNALSAESPVPLAGGENLRGLETFFAIIAARALAVIQPDIGKWGGFSGCLEVGRRARQAGLLFCPHWLGGGIGLMASMHLLAAVGGEGCTEVDANPNPLRERLVPLPTVVEGAVRLPDAPGLGVEPDRHVLREFQVLPCRTDQPASSTPRRLR